MAVAAIDARAVRNSDIAVRTRGPASSPDVASVSTLVADVRNVGVVAAYGSAGTIATAAASSKTATTKKGCFAIVVPFPPFFLVLFASRFSSSSLLRAGWPVRLAVFPALSWSCFSLRISRFGSIFSRLIYCEFLFHSAGRACDTFTRVSSHARTSHGPCP